MNAGAEPLGATAEVALVNVWLHALFSHINMKLKDCLVSIYNNTYPYKAYIKTVLGLRVNKVNLQHRLGKDQQRRICKMKKACR